MPEHCPHCHKDHESSANPSYPARALIGVVIDKSGSMHPRVADVVGGFNRFLADQKALPGDARLIVKLFDSEVTDHSDSPLAEARDLDTSTYQPGGNTALLDAVNSTVNTLDGQTKPGDKVIVVVITDGGENASTHTTLVALKSRIEDHRKAGWEFIFLGADENAWKQAGSMGFSAHTTGAYDNTAVGTRVAYASASANIGAMRSGATGSSLSWDTRNKTEVK